MKIGEKVRLVRVPPGVKDGRMKTRSVFKQCVDHVFPIVGFQHELLELEVGELFGKPAPFETIWIEPEFVERAGPQKSKARAFKRAQIRSKKY